MVDHARVKSPHRHSGAEPEQPCIRGYDPRARFAVGSELVDPVTIKEGRYEVFEVRARQYLDIVQRTRAEMAGQAAKSVTG